MTLTYFQNRTLLMIHHKALFLLIEELLDPMLASQAPLLIESIPMVEK